MTKKQNLAEEMLAAWQSQLQNSFKDPRTIDIFIENYAKLQQNFNQAANNFASSQPKSDPSPTDDVHLQLRDVKAYVQSLETRITILERLFVESK